MSIVRWYIPGRIVYVQWPKNLDWDLLLKINEILLEILNKNTQYSIHIIGDARYTDDVQVLNLYLRREKNFIDHPTLGWTLNIAHNTATGMLGHALPQLAKPSLYRSFHDIYDALDFLSTRDRSLDWDSADDSVFTIST